MASSVAGAAQAAATDAGQITLAEASQNARAAVTDFTNDYFRDRKFDAYLTFKSEEDEREFRKREAERQRAIEEASALHTPAGDARALELSRAQLEDAGAHGAHSSDRGRPFQAMVGADST